MICTLRQPTGYQMTDSVLVGNSSYGLTVTANTPLPSTLYPQDAHTYEFTVRNAGGQIISTPSLDYTVVHASTLTSASRSITVQATGNAGDSVIVSATAHNGDTGLADASNNLLSITATATARALIIPIPPPSVYVSGPVDVNSGPSCRLKYVAVGSPHANISSYTWSSDGTIVFDQGDNSVIISFANVQPGGGHYVLVHAQTDSGAIDGGLSEIIASATGMDCINY